MKEIIIRRSIYDNALEHKLVETDKEGQWLFVPAKEWMPLYLTGDKEIIAFDSDGFGNPIYVGDTIKDLGDNPQPDKVVKELICLEKVGLIVVLEDANKG